MDSIKTTTIGLHTLHDPDWKITTWINNVSSNGRDPRRNAAVETGVIGWYFPKDINGWSSTDQHDSLGKEHKQDGTLSCSCGTGNKW